MIKEELERRD